MKTNRILFDAVVAITMAGAAIGLQACKLASGSTSDGVSLETAVAEGGGGAGGTAGTGGSTTFTASDIYGDWKTACTAKTDPVMGGDHYYAEFDTSAGDGSFDYHEYWFIGDTGSCLGANYAYIFAVGGTYSVGGVASGTAQNITFTYTIGSYSPQITMMSNNAATRHTFETYFNNDCGGTSPYCTLNNGSCNLNDPGSGVTEGIQTATCQTYTFANQGSGGIYETGKNIAAYSSTYGTLYMGASPIGSPGVFSTSSTPTVVTVYYTK